MSKPLCCLHHRVLDLGDFPRISIYPRISLGRRDGNTDRLHQWIQATTRRWSKRHPNSTNYTVTTTEMLICPGWETLVVPVSQPGTPGRDKRGGPFVLGLATRTKVYILSFFFLFSFSQFYFYFNYTFAFQLNLCIGIQCVWSPLIYI